MLGVARIKRNFELVKDFATSFNLHKQKENMDNYVWTHIKNLDELEHIRMSAIRMFLSDYEQGKKEGRYVFHELPV